MYYRRTFVLVGNWAFFEVCKKLLRAAKWCATNTIEHDRLGFVSWGTFKSLASYQIVSHFNIKSITLIDNGSDRLLMGVASMIVQPGFTRELFLALRTVPSCSCLRILGLFGFIGSRNRSLPRVGHCGGKPRIVLLRQSGRQCSLVGLMNWFLRNSETKD